ncbi:MAG TPA: ATP-binding protein, partial [Anaerolineales bacterium]
LYIGLVDDPKMPVVGVTDSEQSIAQLEKEISSRISPPLPCTLDIHETGGKKIIRVLVPRGDDPPYAVDDNKIYVRDEAETGLAVRDEIVGLVLRSPKHNKDVTKIPAAEPLNIPASGKGRQSQPVDEVESEPEPVAEESEINSAPRTGVEVVSVEDRNGARYYSMRDLRNGNMVKNVTRTSARRLWHYAITSFAQLPADLAQADIHWQGNFGLIGRQKQGKGFRYDLIQRTSDGYRYYFGVTEDGIHGQWQELVGQEDE